MRGFIQYIRKHKAMIIILGISFGLRLLFSMDNQKLLFVDIKSYDAYALHILGKGFFSISAYHAPAYPTFLAIVYGVLGHKLIYAYLLQSILGTGITYLIYLIANNIFTEKIAISSAAVSLLYWPLTLYSGILLSEIVFIFFMLTGVYTFLKGMDTHKGVYFFICGFVIAISTLTRSINLLLIFILPAVYIFFNKKKPLYTLLRNSGIYVIIFCLVLAPWIIRNYTLYKALIPVDTLGGVNLYIGNNEKANGFFVDISSDPLNNAGANDYEDDQILKKAAVQYILSHPVRFVFLTLWRALLFIGFDFVELDWVLKTYMDQNFLFQFDFLESAFQLSNIIFFIFSLFGISKLLQNRKGQILVGFVIYYFGLTSLFYIQSRYRLPVMPFAAISCSFTVNKIKAAREVSRP